MTVKRDADGFALELYKGDYPWLDQNRFCSKGDCLAPPSTACAACPVPLMSPAARRLNLDMARAGKPSASDPGSS